MKYDEFLACLSQIRHNNNNIEYNSHLLEPLWCIYCNSQDDKIIKKGICVTLYTLREKCNKKTLQHFLDISDIFYSAEIGQDKLSFFYFAAFFDGMEETFASLIDTAWKMSQVLTNWQTAFFNLMMLDSFPFTASDYSLPLDRRMYACSGVNNRIINYFKYVSLTEFYLSINLNIEIKLEPISSNLHMFSKSPIIIRNASDKTSMVYKPHDMRIDKKINELLTIWNSVMPKEIQLPILNIELFDNNTGYQQFVVHNDKMSEEMCQEYFLKVGALKCFAKLFGCANLNSDSIIATQEGPLIINAECAFDRHIIDVKDIDIILPQIYDSNSDTDKPSYFLINGQLPSSEYISIIEQGFLKAVEVCVNNEATLTDNYLKCINDTDGVSIRIIPRSSTEYNHLIYKYYNGEDFAESISYKDIDIIKNYIDWKLSNNIISEIHVEQMIKVMRNSFIIGNIPYYQLIQRVGKASEILLNGKSIISLHSYFAFDEALLAEEFKANLAWISDKIKMKGNETT